MVDTDQRFKNHRTERDHTFARTPFIKLPPPGAVEGQNSSIAGFRRRMRRSSLVMDRKKSFSHMASSLYVPRSLFDLIMYIRGVKHRGGVRGPQHPCH